MEIPILEQRYIDSCWRHGVPPNAAILSGFFKADVKRSGYQQCIFDIFLDQLKDIDFLPLLEVCMELDSSQIEAVDIRNESSCVFNGEFVFSLMRAINGKLRKVDLRDLSFGKDFLRDLSQRGLTCQVLTLRSSHFRKLNLIGEFARIHTLNLDFSTSLASFREDCFASMPNLRFLSLCDTRISNLWTTSAALLKLPSLLDLRFQHWLCCNDNVSYSSAIGSNSDDRGDLSQPTNRPCDGHFSIDHNLSVGEEITNILSRNGAVISHDVLGMIEDSSDDSELDFSSHHLELGLLDVSSIGASWWNGQDDSREVSHDMLFENGEKYSSSAYTSDIPDVSLKYISHYASPICFKKHYREYMIASLPNLKALDNLPIRKIERERAISTYSRYFEYLPYQRKHKESLFRIIQNREIKESYSRQWNFKQKIPHPSRKSQNSYVRSLCAAKLGSCTWPFLRPLSVSSTDLGDGARRFRPRQFEYHPSDPSLMVYGTLDGEVVVVNHENDKIVSYIPSIGEMNCVLGLCWLKNHPSKLIAGSDNGSLKLYDIRYVSSTFGGIYSIDGSKTFEDFDQLTSVHVNCTDELFLASGYSKNVALYDISTGRLMQVFTDMHREHINVVKFANHSPSIFATSSFDQDIKMWDLRQKPILPCYTSSSSRGNVMVCFSPDDHFLLASAVDNEVRQLLAVDGRLHLNFDIASTGSSQNYTRTYYMNGRDYIISGSCDEHVVRVCCAQTGRRLRDISLEGKGHGNTMFVQSLRGDPFREFNMSILASYVRPSSRSEIVKVNLLASNEQSKDYPNSRYSRSSNQRGG